jgi:hypothetical protein
VAAKDGPHRPSAIRVELNDPSRVDDLRAYFCGVQAFADSDGSSLLIRLPGPTGPADLRQLRAYLDTWLALAAASGRPVIAQVHEQ